MAALTPNTNTLNGGGYLAVAEFLKRVDQRLVGQLCSDNTVPVASGALASDPNLAAMLLDASGIFEAALLAGQRYAPGDIANLLALTGAAAPATVPNAGQGLVYRLLTDLTMSLLWDRRPDKGPKPEKLGWVEDWLAQLAGGVKVLPFLESQEAGVMTDVIETPDDVTARNLTSVQARRVFGRRGDRLCGGPPDGWGGSGCGW